MEKTSIQKTDLEKAVLEAKKVGFDTVPNSSTELEQKIVDIFTLSGKILTAKQVQKILGEKQVKWYSDKLWYMAKKDVLEKLQTRGYYRIFSSKEE